MIHSLRRGAIAGANPWDAETLEWATSSPPPSYNYPNTPVVAGRAPLWESGDELPVMTGLARDRQQVLVTTVLDAEPDSRHDHPDHTIWPFILAVTIGIFFITLIFTPWGMPIGTVLGFVAYAIYIWPRRSHDPAIVELPRSVPVTEVPK